MFFIWKVSFCIFLVGFYIFVFVGDVDFLFGKSVGFLFLFFSGFMMGKSLGIFFLVVFFLFVLFSCNDGIPGYLF